MKFFIRLQNGHPRRSFGHGLAGSSLIVEHRFRDGGEKRDSAHNGHGAGREDTDKSSADWSFLEQKTSPGARYASIV